MKYYIIAGEASGDLHGSNLMKELKELDTEADFRFWGGDNMSKYGGKPVKHIKELAFMGFVEVLLNLRTILKNIKFCKEDIAKFKPDVLVLIDYPGFNMRIAEWAKKEGIRVHYYISPQIWAWKQKRGFKLKRDCDKMYVILPFEERFYKEKFDWEVEFVGHPLLDAIDNFQQNAKTKKAFAMENGLSDKKIIALLPGSRKQEVKVKLPEMLKAISIYQDYEFVIAGAPTLEEDFYKKLIGNQSIKILYNKTYDLLNNAHAALVTSGTATLETALFKVPEVVCYKGSAISYQIAKRLISVDYISLVNLIMEKEVVKELIQYEMNVKNIRKELDLILEGEGRERILNDLENLREKLGGLGASHNVASKLLKSIS
ncbi:MAG: lipid-A-disaccharide synthase [Crocinitomicaceae bacterium]